MKMFRDMDDDYKSDDKDTIGWFDKWHDDDDDTYGNWDDGGFFSRWNEEG